jgi:hypothetical protein
MDRKIHHARLEPDPLLVPGEEMATWQMPGLFPAAMRLGAGP